MYIWVTKEKSEKDENFLKKLTELNPNLEIIDHLLTPDELSQYLRLKHRLWLIYDDVEISKGLGNELIYKIMAQLSNHCNVSEKNFQLPKIF